MDTIWKSPPSGTRWGVLFYFCIQGGICFFCMCVFVCFCICVQGGVEEEHLRAGGDRVQGLVGVHRQETDLGPALQSELKDVTQNKLPSSNDI